MTNKIFYRAVSKLKHSFQCCGYEIWTPLMPDIIVDITEFMGRKQQALLAHQTQLEHADYLRAMLGLNAYRSVQYLEGRRYAEAFLLMGKKDYLDCVRRHTWGMI
jgi:LmbE family N-acetylglucosaminyl deacetylase